MNVLAPMWRSLTALRLAWRELRREPRRGALVIAMVSIPAAALMAMGTVNAGQTPTTDELIRSELGANEAWVADFSGSGEAIQQSPTNPLTTLSPTPASETSPAEITAPDVEALLPAGARTLPLQTGTTVVSTEALAARMQVVAGQTWDPAFAGMYELVEGAVPTGPGEMMLSPAALKALDVAVGDQVSLRDGNKDLTIVGVLRPRVDDPAGKAYVPSADVNTGFASTLTWYLPETALTWDEILALNEHGIIAYSRSVALNPPSVEYPRDPSGPVSPDVLALAVVGLFGVMLLAGSAFSVGFRRDQRRLALLAATGAGRGSLVGVGVATGAVMGAVAGLAGAVVGLAAGFGWVTVLLRWGGPEGQYSTWGYHVQPWSAVVAIVFAVTAGCLAALVPAWVASRLDVVSALRGARRPARPRRRTAWVGGVVSIAGVALLVVASRALTASFDLSLEQAYGAESRASKVLAAGIVVLYLGLVVLTGPALRAIVPLLAPLGVSARLAARDAARNLGRTLPVVAAIGITVAAATGVVSSVERDNRQPTDYWSETPQGDGRVQFYDPSFPVNGDAPGKVVDAIASALPEATVTMVDGFSSQYQPDPSDGASLGIPIDKLCPEWIRAPDTVAMTRREIAADPRCADDTPNLGSDVFSIAVGDADQLRAILGREPSAQALSTLASGGAVALFPEAVVDGRVEVRTWDYGAGNYPDGVSTPAHDEWMAATIEVPTEASSRNYAAIISPQAAARLGQDVAPNAVLVHVDGGITDRQQAEVNAALVSVGDVWLVVERGPSTAYNTNLMYLSLAAALLVAAVSTGVALGLARAEARRDDFTLASLGASPRMARRVAAWQAAIVVATATVLGMTTATAYVWADSHRVLGSTFSQPWLLLAAGLVGAPMLFAALAWVFTRAPKAVHYRLAA